MALQFLGRCARFHRSYFNAPSVPATTTKFRNVLARVSVGSNSPPAFLLQQADFDAALKPLSQRIDTSIQMEPLLKQLTGLTLQSKPQINRFNAHQARAFFARAPNDTGSPEVQCAMMTARMLWLGEHCSANRHDYTAQRKVVELVGQRKRMLKYLRRLSLDRFYILLDALNLPPNYLEAGLAIGNKASFPSVFCIHLDAD
jgi:small subunit ribosomal protein S15